MIKNALIFCLLCTPVYAQSTWTFVNARGLVATQFEQEIYDQNTNTQTSYGPVLDIKYPIFGTQTTHFNRLLRNRTNDLNNYIDNSATASTVVSHSYVEATSDLKMRSFNHPTLPGTYVQNYSKSMNVAEVMGRYLIDSINPNSQYIIKSYTAYILNIKEGALYKNSFTGDIHINSHVKGSLSSGNFIQCKINSHTGYLAFNGVYSDENGGMVEVNPEEHTYTTQQCNPLVKIFETYHLIHGDEYIDIVSSITGVHPVDIEVGTSTNTTNELEHDSWISLMTTIDSVTEVQP